MKDADTVAGRGDRVEVGQQHVPVQSLVDALRHGVGGLDRECQPGDDAHRAEPDHEPGKLRLPALAAQQRAVVGDQLQSDHGRGQAPGAISRAVACSGDRAGDRDVGSEARLGSASP